MGSEFKIHWVWGKFRDCLEEKHRGKDWQHTSSSHLKPSNSSQRLVLPVVIKVKMLKSELRRRSSTAGTDIEYNWNANIESAERKNGKQQDLEKNKERSEVPQDALLCNRIDSKKGSCKDIEPAQNLIERRLRLYMNKDEVICGNDGILTRTLKAHVEKKHMRREFLCGFSWALKMETNFGAINERECTICLFDLHPSATGLAAPVLEPAERFYTLLHDILSPEHALVADRLRSLKKTKAQLEIELSNLQKEKPSKIVEHDKVIPNLVKEEARPKKRLNEILKPGKELKKRKKTISFDDDVDFDAVLDAAYAGFVKTERDKLHSPYNEDSFYGESMEFLAFTYTPNAESIFAPLTETNSFHSKSSDQDDAGYENFLKTLQMARPNDEADLNSTGVTYATMLDIGNLVLAGCDPTYFWQSFNPPTDTILPTHMLNQGSKLAARFSEVNNSSGRSMITLHTDQNLVLYTINFLTDSANPYFESYKTRKWL
ncbi:hypothetical protein VitviT2T_017121 [Vitis vinifera]|uniref:Uncharacterized protein n=1 Tax=Vitis vinifera TaxID=29760 RepID=A0ABY9CU07_VITVI|nr:hypothetical protein VitviT2T_017121 [Vitis vinifera]